MKKMSILFVILSSVIALSGCLSSIPDYYEEDRAQQQKGLDEMNDRYAKELEQIEKEKKEEKSKNSE